jgi:hypothetical protein
VQDKCFQGTIYVTAASKDFNWRAFSSAFLFIQAAQLLEIGQTFARETPFEYK